MHVELDSRLCFGVFGFNIRRKINTESRADPLPSDSASERSDLLNACISQRAELDSWGLVWKRAEIHNDQSLRRTE